MITLYAKYRLLTFIFALMISIFMTIYTFLNYKRKKYNKLFGYGYLIITVSIIIIIIDIINRAAIIFDIFALIIGIIGLSLVIAGEIRQRYVNRVINDE